MALALLSGITSALGWHRRFSLHDEFPTATSDRHDSFARLAAVEVQVIMQHCDLLSLLRLAHCSRWILACASSAFALKHTVAPLFVATATLDARFASLVRSK